LGWLWWIRLLAVLALVLLGKVGGRTGGGTIVLWLLAGALLGWLALRRRGFRTRRQGKKRPEGFLDRALVVAAALLLIWPGPLTDVAGLYLLLPPVRRRAVEALRHVVWFGQSGAEDAGDAEEGDGVEPAARSGETHGQFPGAREARDVDFQPIRAPAAERQ